MDVAKYRQIVEKAGGQWVGIQEAVPPLEHIVLFNTDKNKSTLALPLSEVSVENVERLKTVVHHYEHQVPTQRESLASIAESLKDILIELQWRNQKNGTI